MTLARINGPGFGVGTEMTSAQATDIDANIEGALDKRSGQTDTLSSIVTLAGAGRVVTLAQNGADANGSYLLSAGGLILVPVGLTAIRSYTLSTTGAVTGDIMEVWADEALSAYAVDVIAGVTTLLRVGPGGQTYHGVFRFNGTAWKNHVGFRAGLVVEEFLTSGTFTPKPGVSQVLVIGCGAGGAGAGGMTNSTAADRWVAGGAGGGGAWAHSLLVTIGAGTYAVTIGAGGAGGTAGLPGADGGDSILHHTSGAVDVAVFRGAAGGYAQVSGFSILSTIVLRTRGGAPVRGAAYEGWGNVEETRYDTAAMTAGAGAAPYSFAAPVLPATGGVGEATSNGGAGRLNPTGHHVAGSAGTKGADSGTQRGGGGGGGGGAGPYEAGQTGGNGSAGAAGASSAGGPGSPGQNNSGAGGGGGGASGAGGGGSGAGGTGGNGGSGRMYIVYSR